MVINPNALGLDLPPGTVRVQPSFWQTDEPLEHTAWDRLVSVGAASGMHPVLLAPGWDDDGENLDPGRMSSADDHDAEEVLADFWASVGDDGAWPGLAPARPLPAGPDPDRVAADVAAGLLETPSFADGRAALVPARTTADVPSVLGWSGPANHEGDTGRLCAVLRSWEARFGIRVVALRFDVLDLSVAAPPRTLQEALPVAAEHLAFCPDNVWQGAGSLRSYAESLLDAPHHWTFWWD